MLGAQNEAENFHYLSRVASLIIDYVRETDINLICLGSHSKNEVISDMLRTTTDLVLRNAPCSVLIVRTPATKIL
ncbi:MAG: universal stress protein [Acidobacteriota bacterium]